MKANKKKDTILKMLKENSDRYISGEELSEMFNVSRTAIWKTLTIYEKWVTRLTQLQTEATNLCHHRVF